MDDKQRIEYNHMLCDYITEWQKLLKLDEWNIAVGIANKQALENKTSTVQYDRTKAQAFIAIIDKDEAKTAPFGFDEEVEIVRQLLQLRYEMVTTGPESLPYLQRAHSIVARLLVALKKNSRSYRQMVEELCGAKEDQPEKTTPRVINT